MQIGLLGDLQVLDDDERDVVVTGAKLRALLVMLALHCGRAVQADQLVDALWGPESSSAARNGLQGLVSKLRRALGSASLVATRGGGYALEVPPEAVDLHRFEQLVAAGRARATSCRRTLRRQLPCPRRRVSTSRRHLEGPVPQPRRPNGTHRRPRQ